MDGIAGLHWHPPVSSSQYLTVLLMSGAHTAAALDRVSEILLWLPVQKLHISSGMITQLPQ